MSSAELREWYWSLGGREYRASRRWTQEELKDRLRQMLHKRSYRLRFVSYGDVQGKPQSSVVFGVALFNVPIQALVSQGFESLTLPRSQLPSNPNTTPLPPTALASRNFVVHQAAFYRPGQDGYIFQGDPPSTNDEGQPITLPDSSLYGFPSYHMVRQIRNTDTGEVYTPTELQSQYGAPALIGMQRSGENGFTLYEPHAISDQYDAYIILHPGPEPVEDGPETASLEGSLIDLFHHPTAQAFVQDIGRKLHAVQAQQNDVLGALIVSSSSFMEVQEAFKFADVFPQVPCLGWYAHRQLGPPLVVGGVSSGTSQLEHDEHRQRAGVHSDAAVFVLFVTPPQQPASFASLSNADIQDDPETIQRAIQSHLLRARRPNNQRQDSKICSMDDWNVDAVLRVLPFSSLSDSNRFQLTSRRYWYLVQEYRRLHTPNMVTITREDGRSGYRCTKYAHGMMQYAVHHKLQTPPNFLIASFERSSTLRRELPGWIPSDCVVLGTMSAILQTTVPICSIGPEDGLLLATLPPNSIYPFTFTTTGEAGSPTSSSANSISSTTLAATRDLIQQIQSHATQYFDGKNSSAIFIHGIEYRENQVDHVLATLQQAFPQTTLVGGLCQGGFVSESFDSSTTAARLDTMSRSELREWYLSLGGREYIASRRWTEEKLKNCVRPMLHKRSYRLRFFSYEYVYGDPESSVVFGVALFNVPVQAVASQSFESLTLSRSQLPSNPNTTPLPATALTSRNFVVHQAAFYRPGQDGYIFQGDPPSTNDEGQPITLPDSSLYGFPSYHMVRQIRDTDTGEVYTPTELQSQYGAPALIGMQRSGENGFTLYESHAISDQYDAYIILHPGPEPVEDGPETASLEGSLIDLFHHPTAQAFVQDIGRKLHAVQAQQNDVLGALIVGSSDSSLDVQEACKFADVFPQVPCLGWYAHRQLGPPLVVGGVSSGTSQLEHDDHRQRACVHSDAAVFVLFVTPHQQPPSFASFSNAEIHDDADTIQRAIQSHLLRGRRPINQPQDVGRLETD